MMKVWDNYSTTNDHIYCLLSNNNTNNNNNNYEVNVTSSNGYYGYQQFFDFKEENRINRDVEMCNCNNKTQRFTCRKRAWEGANEFFEIKKKRFNNNEKLIETKSIMQDDNYENNLYEELLRETHGCSIYHWVRN